MSLTLRLLKYDPAVAMLIMVNNHFNINLRDEFAKVNAPVALNAGTLTKVVVETFDSINDFIPRVCTGQLEYTYNRIHVAEIFGDMKLDLTPPVTVYGVMTELSRASGMVFTEADFVNALIETDKFTLTAKPGSLRWVGSTTVSLNEPGTALELADAFQYNILNGLIPPDFSS